MKKCGKLRYNATAIHVVRQAMFAFIIRTHSYIECQIHLLFCALAEIVQFSSHNIIIVQHLLSNQK